MNNLELIEKSYLEAVKGIKEDWFVSRNTNWYDYVTSLPDSQKITYLIVVLHNQVLNGGFHQYFVNGYGQFAQETIVALLNIGALKRAKLLEIAYKTVNRNDESAVIFRMQLLDKTIKSLFVSDELYEPFDELDNEYYSIVDEEIEDLLGGHLKSI